MTVPPLLRPPSHRGPLLAAGAAVLTVGVALQQLRLAGEWDAGVNAVLTAGLAAAFLWLAVQAPLEGGRPPAYQSVLTVCGLIALLAAAWWTIDALSGDPAGGYPAARLTLAFALHAAAAAALAARRNSGAATLIAALSGAGAALSLLEWIADPGSATPFRWLLLALALAFVVLSLVLRGSRPRGSEQLVNAAGLAVLGIPLPAIAESVFFGFAFTPEAPLGGFWELVTLAAGFGLVAYAAVDRAPGPAYLGLLNLAAFAAVASLGAGPTLEWWPLTLIGAGAIVLGAALRPVRPLPPEPPPYRAGELPLSVRVEGEETVIRVRE